MGYTPYFCTAASGRSSTDSIVHRLSARSERRLVKTLLADFQKVHGKTALLFRIAEAALNNPDGLVKEVVYPVAGEDTLISLLIEFKSSGPAYQQQIHKILRSSYSNHYRRMLPKILDAMTFCFGNSAWTGLKSMRIVPSGIYGLIIPSPWKA